MTPIRASGSLFGSLLLLNRSFIEVFKLFSFTTTGTAAESIERKLPETSFELNELFEEIHYDDLQKVIGGLSIKVYCLLFNIAIFSISN